MSTNNINRKKTLCNPEEHKAWNRRSFLQALGLVGGGVMTMANTTITAGKPSPLAAALNTVENDRVLVILRLKGGNDGLNTVVPLYDYDTYKNLRPNLALEKSSLFNLSDEFGMPTNAIEKLWKEGQMKVVHGVGYEGSSRSHFKGSDIWATADPENPNGPGGLGRYYDRTYTDFLNNPPERPVAIQIGGANQFFSGEDLNYAFSVSNPKTMEEVAKTGQLFSLDNIPTGFYGSQVEFLRGVSNSTFSYAGVISDSYNKTSKYDGWGSGRLSSEFQVVSRLIKGNLGTKVYFLTAGGYDTHANQDQVHVGRISSVLNVISTFYEDLEAAGVADKVLTMTISEFGRKAVENGSRGTDHGAAAPVMFFGSGLEGSGFVGEHPDLSQLDNGALAHTTDFRQVYSAVFKDWLCMGNGVVDEVLGGTYDSVPLGFECNSTLSVGDNYIPKDVFDHFATYSNDRTFLNIIMKDTAHVQIKLYNMLGQDVGTLKNAMLLGGNHVIDIKETIGRDLDDGQYVYRINVSNRSFSKSILLM